MSDMETKVATIDTVLGHVRAFLNDALDAGHVVSMQESASVVEFPVGKMEVRAARSLTLTCAPKR